MQAVVAAVFLTPAQHAEAEAPEAAALARTWAELTMYQAAQQEPQTLAVVAAVAMQAAPVS
jgi:hypothetical protein